MINYGMDPHLKYPAIIVLIALFVTGCYEFDEILGPNNPTSLSTLDTPTNLTIQAHAPNPYQAATINWDYPADTADTFTIQRALGMGTFTDLATVSGAAESYFDTTLTAGTEYTYAVRAHSDDGSMSDQATVTSATAPVAPTSFTAIGSPSGGSWSFNWTLTPSNQVVQIVTCVADDGPNIEKTVAAGATSFVFTGLPGDPDDVDCYCQTENAYGVRSLPSNVASYSD